MQILSNVHTHSTFSDGKNAPEETVRAALALGFHTLGFSDHGCADYDNAAMKREDEPAYKAQIRALADKYRGQIRILLGYEHDWLSPKAAADYDYTIESVHYVPANGELWSVDWTRGRLEDAIRRHYGGDPYALCRDYFRTVSGSIQGTGAAIIGHIELVMKFNEVRDLFDDADPRYLSAALETAELAAHSGRLIEVNTGAIAKGYRTEPYPGRAMLRRIRECGGRVILSSDCHNAAFLNCAFPQALALLRACGFDTVWEYVGAEQVEREIP